ncbi:Protein UGT-58 [Aphelenchoides avenae]|nr:Protein UGT-58 [Aphelenchus avenae]
MVHWTLLCLAALAPLAWTAEVLIMPSSLFPMHRYTMSHLAEELIKRKHSVTWFEYGLKKSDIKLPAGVRENFVQVDVRNHHLRDVYEHRNASIHNRLWEEGFWDEAERTSAWLASVELCDALLSNEKHLAQFQRIVDKKFDAVVKSVFIYWSLTGLRTESAWANQSPSPPSYIPVHGTGLTDELNFWQRSYNMAAYLRALYVHQHIVLRRIDALSQKHFPGQLTPAFDMERNASINFVNHPPIFDFARPYMPRVNFVGGLHCRKANPLPPVLAKFVDAANEKEGFFVITTGYTAQWKRAPKNVIQSVVDAVKAKPEIRFVWQYDGEPIVNKPDNLYIASWLPQQDLLGHPKCRAHISHGGQNSVIESVWHGVPVIGWPMTQVGYDNLLRVTARNAGLMLEKKQPTKTDLVSAINRIFIRHYKDEMLIFQDMVIDVPYTELNHSAFWVEFIVRHQEVPHARSGADELNIIQYFLVDVIAFLISAIIVVCMVVYYLLKLLVRFLFFLVLLPFRRKSAGKPDQKITTAKKKN